jgi:hypothetical protein
MKALTLNVQAGEYAVWQLPADAPLVEPADAQLWSVTRTGEELSGVSQASLAPERATVEGGWRSIRVAGTLPFDAVGVLASLVDPLAQAGVSVFALSTFNTDYLLVKAEQLDLARTTLEAAGHALSASHR